MLDSSIPEPRDISPYLQYCLLIIYFYYPKSWGLFWNEDDKRSTRDTTLNIDLVQSLGSARPVRPHSDLSNGAVTTVYSLVTLFSQLYILSSIACLEIFFAFKSGRRTRFYKSQTPTFSG